MTEDCLSACTCCPKVDSCCCCSVRTGSITIGFVLIFFGILYITLNVLRLSDGHYLRMFDLAILILMIITGVALLIGIFQDSPLLVKISLILLLVMIALYAVFLILAIVELAKADKESWYRDPLLFLLTSILRLSKKNYKLTTF